MTTPTALGPAGTATGAQPAPRRRRAAVPLLVILGVDILAIVIFGVLSPDFAFLTPRSFTDLALDGSETVLLSVSVALLLGAGELDISLGANVILSSVVGGKVMSAMASNPGAAIAVGTLVCILTGATGGLVNSIVVTRLRVNSFIATLATLGIMTGLADVISNGYNISNIPLSLQTGFGIANLLGVIPDPSVIVLVIVVAVAWMLARTRFGLHTLALGSSREAAVRAGVRVRRTLTSLFMFAGACTGICGVFDISRYTTTNLSGHQTDALAAIAGAVIGGTNLFGGKVSVWGAALGALLAVILQDGLVVVGLQSFYQLIAVGIVLIAAVSLRGFTNSEGRSPLGRRSRLIQRRSQ
jgi:ribose transport system permease protein